MATLATLFVRVLADTAAAQKQLATMGTTVTKAGDRMSSAGMKMSKFVTLPILGAGVAAVKFAASAAETENKVKVTFENMAGSVIKWSNTSLDKMGIAKATAQEMASTFGLLFQAAKLPGPVVTDMSKKFANLAVDMSSFFDIPFEDALVTLRSGLVGETEPLRRFGVLLNEANVAGEAVRIGIAKTGAKLTEQQKVIARASFIQQALTKATGDYARTAGSTSNQIRTMKERFKETASSIGQHLLPVADKILGWAKDALSWFQGLTDSQKQLAVKIGAVAAAAGPLLFIGGKLVKVFGGLIGGVGKLIGGFGKLAGSMAGVGTKAAGAASAVGKVAPAMSTMAMVGQGSLLVIGAAFIAASATIIATTKRVKELTTELLTAKTAWADLEPQVRKNAGTLEGTALQFGVLNRESRAQSIAAGNLISVQKNQYRGVRDLNKVLLDGNRTLSEGEKASIKSALATRNFALANVLLRREAQEAKAAIAAQGRATDSLSRGAKAGLEGNEAVARGMEHVRAAAERARKHTKDLDTSYTTLAGRKPAMLEAGVKTQKAHSDLNKWTAAIREVPGSVDTKANFETSAAHAKLEKLIADYRRKKAEIEGTIHVAVTGGDLPNVNVPKPRTKGGGGAGGGTSPQQFRTPGMAGATIIHATVNSGPSAFDIERMTVRSVRKSLARRRRL